ncbi:MAG: cupin domain-containing protein [Hyphomicrobiaceae bacterium]
MNGTPIFHRTHRAASAACALALATALSAGTAFAGECPAQHVTTNGQKPGATAHKHVTDKVLAAIPLAREKVALKDHQFRLRRLVIQPGGEVAWHSHAERPAIIYIVSGMITEYSSTCAVPIRHKAGDVARETSATSHWWKNHGKQPAILLSADILHEKDDPHTM